MSTNRSLCPQCGWDVAVDEDGCCVVCGALALGAGVDAAAMEIARLTAEKEEAFGAYRKISNDDDATIAEQQAEIARLKAAVEARDAVRNDLYDQGEECIYCGEADCEPTCPLRTHPVKP